MLRISLWIKLLDAYIKNVTFLSIKLRDLFRIYSTIKGAYARPWLNELSIFVFHNPSSNIYGQKEPKLLE